MAFTWGELRDQVRIAILKDVLSEDTPVDDLRWDDPELLISLEWALAQFAEHTAMATATGFTPATGSMYTLPDNIYDGDGTENTLFVAITDTGKSPVYLDSVRYTPMLSPMGSKGFYIHPDNTLQIGLPSTSTTATLTIQYFAYYPVPAADSDPILVPRWARMALAYLVGAHALSGASLKTATIRQFATKPDAGSPVDNPLRVQQKWFLEFAEAELRKHPRQDRVNAFRALRDGEES